jgi:FKBP-type peptidyl-prolyl cis-trans isomerase FkpA
MELYLPRQIQIKLLVAFLLFVAGCNTTNEFPGYKKTTTGIYFQLLQLGDERKPSPGDFITVDVIYKTMQDSVFFSGRRKIQLRKPSYKGSIDECFMMMQTGEKAEFIIDAEPFFINTLHSSLPSFIKPDSKMKVRIHMLDLQTKQDYEHEKQAFLKWIDDLSSFEKEVLKQFVHNEHVDIQPTESGLYKLQIKKGKGKKVAIGDTVIVHYEGRFLDGKFFDSTKQRNEAFGFVYGTEWQVVEGLEEAIGSMREGEKSLFIIPSELAFGRKGSSTGIVPPYTSVIFEVELLTVK